MITAITAIAPKIVSKNAGRSKKVSPVFLNPILNSGAIMTIDIISVNAPDIKSRIIQVS